MILIESNDSMSFTTWVLKTEWACVWHLGLRFRDGKVWMSSKQFYINFLIVIIRDIVASRNEYYLNLMV